MDADSDGFVNQDELREWTRYTLQKYMRDNLERTWRKNNPENKDKLTWEEYSNLVYGFMKGTRSEIL